MDAQSLKELFGSKVRFWTGSMSVEDAAVKQLQNIAELPILAGHIAIMPDVHMGKGATVGSVIPTLSAVIPSAVGVDIGCGMIAVRTGLTASDLPDSLAEMRAEIERRVPVGFAFNNDVLSIAHEGVAAAELQRRYDTLMASFHGLSLFTGIGHFDEQRMARQISSLGGDSQNNNTSGKSCQFPVDSGAFNSSLSSNAAASTTSASEANVEVVGFV
jgi:tRNA-splicing ligase RtcB (3'-phosphate/5'-hydroxy nucleic acid ligase)